MGFYNRYDSYYTRRRKYQRRNYKYAYRKKPYDKRARDYYKKQKRKQLIKDIFRAFFDLFSFPKETKIYYRFDTYDEAFEHWFKKYEHRSKWRRNRLILKRMSDSRCHSFLHCHPSSQEIKEKLAKIDEARLNAEKQALIEEFEYLFTFTYDDAKNSEKAFKKDIKKCLRGLERRHGWVYLGVWMRSRNNGRLYAQALVKTKDGEIVGGLEEVKDFQMRGRWMKSTLQSPYFNERFGRTVVERFDKAKIEQYQHHIGTFLERVNGEKSKRFWARKISRRLTKDFHVNLLEKQE